MVHVRDGTARYVGGSWLWVGDGRVPSLARLLVAPTPVDGAVVSPDWVADDGPRSCRRRAAVEGALEALVGRLGVRLG